MKTPADTFKISISLPGNLARFVEREMETEEEPNRSGVIQNALRLMQTLKRQFEAGSEEAAAIAGPFIAGQVVFTREEIVRLFPAWERGERRTLDTGKRGERRTLNAELPTPKGGDSTSQASDGKRRARRNEGVRASARVPASSPHGGSNLEATPLTLTPTPTLTLPANGKHGERRTLDTELPRSPLPSEGEPSTANAGSVTPSAPLPSIENRNSKFENLPAR